MSGELRSRAPGEAKSARMNDLAGGASLEAGVRPLVVLGVYPWDRFWSMGEFRGAPSFYRAPKALVDAGHRVFISMPGAGRSPRSEEYHGIRLLRYGPAINFMPMSGPSVYLHLTKPFRYIYYIILASLAGLRAAREVGPDVVVGYGAWGAAVGFLVARCLGLPNVTRLFGQSLSLGFERGLKAKIRLALNYPEVIAFSAPCSCLVLHNDGSGGDVAAARLGVPRERLRYWRNGIDKELFRPPESRTEAKLALGLDPEAPLLLSVGRLDAEKHHERLIRAIPEVVASAPNAVAVICGEGPERNRLEAEAERLGVVAAVRLPGPIPPEKLAGYYRACDIFVTLSERTNSSNPTDEAMSCGACVVALDVGDTSESVRHDDTGVLVSGEELRGLGRVIAELLADRRRRAALGERAARHAQDVLPSVEERGRMEADAVAGAAARGRNNLDP